MIPDAAISPAQHLSWLCDGSATDDVIPPWQGLAAPRAQSRTEDTDRGRGPARGTASTTRPSSSGTRSWMSTRMTRQYQCSRLKLSRSASRVRSFRSGRAVWEYLSVHAAAGRSTYALLPFSPVLCRWQYTYSVYIDTYLGNAGPVNTCCRLADSGGHWQWARASCSNGPMSHLVAAQQIPSSARLHVPIMNSPRTTAFDRFGRGQGMR